MMRKFGKESLYLDGNSDYITTSGISSFGDGPWCWEAWIYFRTVTANQELVRFGGYGAILRFDPTGKLRTWLSSDGATWNIASAVFGTKASWSTNRPGTV